MQFLPEELEEFKTLYFNRFGEEITSEQAIDYLGRYVDIFKIIMKPPHHPQL